MANIIQCGKLYALLLMLRTVQYMVMMTKQMQLCVVILRKYKEIDQCPHVISASGQPRPATTADSLYTYVRTYRQKVVIC